MKVSFYNGTILPLSGRGVFPKENRKQDTITIINREEAITALVDTVRDFGHWIIRLGCSSSSGNKRLSCGAFAGSVRTASPFPGKRAESQYNGKFVCWRGLRYAY